MSTSRPISVTLGALGGDPREALVRLSTLGSGGVGGVQLSASQHGMRPRDLDSMARRGLRERIKQLELRITGIDLWIPPGHFADPQHVDRASTAVREAIHFAAEFDRVGVSMSLPRDPAVAKEPPAQGRDAGWINANAPLDRPGITTAESFAVFVAGGESDDMSERRADQVRMVLADLLDEADRHGIDLIDHAVPPRRAEATHHRLRVGIDPAAWLAHGHDPTMAAAQHAARVSMVRLCDLTVGGLRAPIADELTPTGHAERQLDPRAFAGALSVVGRTLPLVVDLRQWPEPWAGVTQTLEVWERAAREP